MQKRLLPIACHKKLIPWCIYFLLFTFSGLTFPETLLASDYSKFLALGTGSENGVFFPIGQGICDRLNAGRSEHGYRCLAYTTGAAVYNLQAINSRELDLGITYSDLSQDAYNGKGIFSAFKPNRELRSIAALYTMPAGILVRRSSGINSFADFKGKRINIGNAGSGKRMIADLIGKVMNWHRDDFNQVSEMSTTEVEKAFCNGEVDVIVEAMAVSSDFFNKMTNECDGRFVSIPDDVLARIQALSPTLGKMVITGQTYPYNDEDFNAVQINAVLVTTDRVDEDAIYAVTKSIFSDYDKFTNIHPALVSGCQVDMVNNGKFLPFHAGAMKYYNEVGLSCR